MRIHIGGDHAAYELQQTLIAYLEGAGHEVVNHGPFRYDEQDDYPAFVLRAAAAVAAESGSRGVVLGGSGNGEQMAANKVRGIRCALCWNETTAELSRRHNDANVLSLGQRMMTPEQTLAIVDRWIATPFDGGRHEARIRKLDAIEP